MLDKAIAEVFACETCQKFEYCFKMFTFAQK